MKLRAMGTGSDFCRWPLIPSCWLLQTHNASVLIGCPPQAAARLELLGISMDNVDMIVPLGTSVAEIGGIDEFGHHFYKSSSKPLLACPEKLLSEVLNRLQHPGGLSPKAVKKIGFKEEHVTESLTFIDNLSGGYGFRLEHAKIFCSGTAFVSEDWLNKHMDCALILHCDSKELQELPVNIQEKVWIYAYDKPVPGTDPLPMLYMPQGQYVLDSDRRDKVMTKERFIRENSKRVVGNESQK